MAVYILFLQALRFHKSNDIHMSQIRIIDSPQTHILLLGCNDVEFESLFIKSPDGSPNTDGIHIQATNNVFINSSFIGSGNCLSSWLLQKLLHFILLYIREIALISLLASK